MKWYTINALGADGKSYALYFECKDIIDASNIVHQLGLVPDKAGICVMKESLEWDEGICNEISTVV